MPHYYKMGDIPAKRHTQFRKPDGKLYSEELVSTEGFSDIYSLIYHNHIPTAVKSIGEPIDIAPKIAEAKHLKMRKYFGFETQPEDDFLESRKPIMVNNELQITLAAPRKSMTDYFYKNSSADEVIFVHKGSGKMKSIYGELNFEYGDYIIIPRGTIYQLEFNDENNRLFIVESYGPISYPKRYRNEFGQLLEHSPYCERDIHPPQSLKTYDEEGDFKVMIKKEDVLYPYTYAYHPFDAIGWDGNLYPYTFSIHDFEPITGRVHQPPPVHQTFAAPGFVICSFVPRKYDYHPNSIPAPYNHSNVDSDEVLYYVEPKFMSRTDVVEGMISLHPLGIPHGPHGAAVEKSIGKEETEELAVMVDTFKPLKLTEYAAKIEDPDYYKSWIH
ncbi:MAG: homogentisate 1,2-dioxygenase [Chitinophagales bacterium]